ncbi:MAG TPA: MaoC/PaaZ C-terminal domain-containing protein [Pseudonocardiaceae bacterium]|jgi:acyl dehydratase|nr:MaoC/PaaZ C-terminal domain-containing protein [Pseudonocardiaceae bacterium]
MDTTVELDSTPNLTGLFGKAALGVLPGFGRCGDALPDTTYAQTGVRIDRERLAGYDRVCGFRVSDELPGTFPHILSFPLQAKLMTDPDFPFPMIGLVHLANRISRTRPIGAEETLVLRVHAEGLRPHERGTQFDMVSEALSDGEVVWTDVSTYLRRGGSAGPSERGAKVDAQPLDGEPAARWHLGGDTGRRYAEVSGDHNPIHLYPLTARLFGFKRAIAHGMWSKARCLAFFEGRLPSAYTVDVRFKRPILQPATVALHSESTEDGFRFALRDAGKDIPHLDGTISAG